MASSLIFTSIFAIFLLVQLVNCQYVDEPQQYAATAVPKDPTSVRQALGYNKYDGRDVQNSDKAVVYGNNWESFDNANQPSQGQNQYYARQQQGNYRYKRSPLNFYYYY